MNYKEFLQSKTFKGILYGFGLAAILFIVLAAGMRIGERRAEFSDRWGGNFRQTFGAPPMPMPMGGPNNFTEAHGVTGKIIKISLPTIIVEGADKV